MTPPAPSTHVGCIIAIAFFAIVLGAGLPAPPKTSAVRARVMKHQLIELPEAFIVTMPMPGFPSFPAPVLLVPEDLPAPAPLEPIMFIRRGADGIARRIQVPPALVPAAMMTAIDVTTMFLDA